MENQPDTGIPDPEFLITTEQAADYLGLAARTLETWRTKRYDCGPVFYRIGRSVRYSQTDLATWAYSQRQRVVPSN